MKQTCKVHEVIWEYLERLYTDFHGKGFRHIAFENINTKEYRATEKIIKKKQCFLLEKLQKEAEEKRRYEEELAQAKQAMMTLKRVC
jgi:hypothetical protein